jgi:hypothetical protein
MTASVSVVIPCYNYGHFLGAAVGSALDDQPGMEVRVLVIDDASTDGSAEVARAIAARDPRVQVLAHATNRGHIATYNEGLLDWADGDYSVLLSADDRLAPGTLRRTTDLLDAHPEAGFAYGHPIRFREGTPPPAAKTTVRGWSVWPGPWWLERRCRTCISCISSPEVVVRTSLQKMVGGYDPQLPHTGDTEMWLRLAAHADVGYIRGADQAFYRIHENNMTKTRTTLVDLHQRRLAYEKFLDRCAASLPEAARLSDMVHRKLCWQALWSPIRRRWTSSSRSPLTAGRRHDGWASTGACNCGPGSDRVSCPASRPSCWRRPAGRCTPGCGGGHGRGAGCEGRLSTSALILAVARFRSALPVANSASDLRSRP